MKVAVIGGGWAGIAAAVTAAQKGHDVTVLEAARSLGGRARGVPVTLPDGRELILDNGQHILIGAYSETLRLMRTVGVDPDKALLRLPLALAYADNTGLALPKLAAPLDALVGILGARGWAWSNKFALLKTASRWRSARFTCDAHTSVAQLCQTLPRRLQDEFIEPLCISALNTPAGRASGAVFLRVLQDAMFGGPGCSNLLLPRQDLGALFPDAAAAWLKTREHTIHTGRRITSLRQNLGATGAIIGWQVDGETFDQVVLAVAPADAARLIAEAAGQATGDLSASLRHWSDCASALSFEAITTVYALADASLPRPMLALRSGPQAPAQFVFDRGQVGCPRGLLAFVISISTGEREELQHAVVQQAQAELGLVVTPFQTITEKRATFACTPGLVRPEARIAPGPCCACVTTYLSRSAGASSSTSFCRVLTKTSTPDPCV